MRTSILINAALAGIILLFACGGDSTKKQSEDQSEKSAPMIDIETVHALMTEKTCFVCHTVDGSNQINSFPALGPTLKGILGKSEVVLKDGIERQVVIDETYLFNSIKNPMSEIVKGYNPVMITPPLTDEEIKTIVDYIKTL